VIWYCFSQKKLIVNYGVIFGFLAWAPRPISSRRFFSKLRQPSTKLQGVTLRRATYVNAHKFWQINSLEAELNLICHLLALSGAHHILHVSRITVNSCFTVDVLSWIFSSHWSSRLMFANYRNKITFIPSMKTYFKNITKSPIKTILKCTVKFVNLGSTQKGSTSK
jgi:hypothetical protein